MTTGRICCLVLLTLGVLAVVVVLLVTLTQPKCAPQQYLHGAVAADTETCSNIGRDILKRGGSAVDAAIAGLICTSVMNPQSSGLGGGVVFTIYNASTGTVEVINARETAPQGIPSDLLSGCTSLHIGERPPSAMVPSILISKSGDMLVIGGAGGDWIISATAMAIINKLWFGYDLERAISSPIMHTNKDSILFEEHFSQDVRNSLLKRGHKEQKVEFSMNVVQGVSKEGKCISAYSDKRKLGKSAGY